MEIATFILIFALSCFTIKEAVVCFKDAWRNKDYKFAWFFVGCLLLIITMLLIDIFQLIVVIS